MSEKAKRGRPPLPEEKRRTTTLRVKLTHAEALHVQQKAEKKALPVYAWAREQLLKK